MAYSNAYMLYLLGSVRVTRVSAKAFHPSIGDAVGENHQRLHEFSRHMFTSRHIPGPPQFRERSKVTSKSNQAITPENAALCTS